MKNRLKVLRAERDWTQAQLAEQLEVSRQTINAIEKGKFDPSLPLTRVAVPSASPDLFAELPQLIEWGGARRWISAEIDIEDLRGRLQAVDGSACAFRGHAPGVAVFQPLPRAMLKLQRNLKSSFDPAGIFNPGKIYPGL